MIAFVAQSSWPIFQLNVKSTFLHRDLEEQIFINQSPSYIQVGNKHNVYKLKKTLYGQKKAPRAWYSRINTYFSKEGFQKYPYEHILSTKLGDGGKLLIVCLYVDDLILTRNDSVIFEKIKKCMMVEFEMTELGKIHYFLGIEVVQFATGIFISQRKHCKKFWTGFK